MKTELKAFHIDRDFVMAHDVGDVMAPVRLRANFYEGPEEYEASLAGFSREQRWLFAIYWHDAEINNGGQEQFYFNSTGCGPAGPIHRISCSMRETYPRPSANLRSRE